MHRGFQHSVGEAVHEPLHTFLVRGKMPAAMVKIAAMAENGSDDKKRLRVVGDMLAREVQESGDGAMWFLFGCVVFEEWQEKENLI